MKKHDILNHFKNGDVVECLISGATDIFQDNLVNMLNYQWVLLTENTTIFLEKDGKLARIIQHDKTEVYAQLGKEVLEILNSNPNDSDAGSKIRKLYGK